MLNLIFKDIIVQKRSLLFMLFYLIICVFSFKSMPTGTFLYLVTITLIFFLITGSYSYDERNKSDLVISSLPITRKEIIISKYISIIIYNAVALCIMTIFMFGVKILNLSLSTQFFTLNDVLNVFISSLVLASIMFPIYSKFGFTKSRIITFIIYFSLFGIINSIAISPDKRSLNSIYVFLQSISSNNYIILAIAFMIYILSMYFSIKIYENKELA